MRISDWSSDVCSSDLFRKQRLPGLEESEKIVGNPPFIAYKAPDLAAEAALRLHISLVAIDIQHHRPRLDLSFEPLEGRLCRGGRIFVPASTVLPRHEPVPRCINRHFGCLTPESCRFEHPQKDTAQ